MPVARPGRGRGGENVVDLDGLYSTYRLSLIRLAIQLVDDQATAEDVVHDVFAAVSESNRNRDWMREPQAYLRVAVVNRCRSVLRRRKVARLLGITRPEVAEPADGALLQTDRRHTVLAVVDSLPRRQREVVVLRYYEDLSIAEIASVLQIKSSAASSSLSRAMTTLATRLDRNA